MFSQFLEYEKRFNNVSKDKSQCVQLPFYTMKNLQEWKSLIPLKYEESGGKISLAAIPDDPKLTTPTPSIPPKPQVKPSTVPSCVADTSITPFVPPTIFHLIQKIKNIHFTYHAVG